jgi:phage recombination protein Bet
MKKPCHIVGMSVKNPKTQQNEWRDVIMPGISELRITAQRTGQYAGQDAPIFGAMVEMKFGNTTHMVPESCTVTVYRDNGKGLRYATPHTEYFEEACAKKKDGDLNSMWATRKRGQLAKCAEAGALRKAFPDEIGGVATAEEMDGREMRDVTPRQSSVEMPPMPMMPSLPSIAATTTDDLPFDHPPKTAKGQGVVVSANPDSGLVSIKGEKKTTEMECVSEEVFNAAADLLDMKVSLEFFKSGDVYVISKITLNEGQ